MAHNHDQTRQSRTVRVYCAGKIRECNDWRPGTVRDLSGSAYDCANVFGVGLLADVGDVELIYVGPFAYACGHGCSHGPTSHGNGLGSKDSTCQDAQGDTPIGPILLRIDEKSWLDVGHFSGETLLAAEESGSEMKCRRCLLGPRSCRCARRVVYERSIEQIDRADLVIARPEVDSFGTLLEIGYATKAGKSIVVDLNGQADDLAAELWFATHAHRCTDPVLEDVAKAILGYGPEKWGPHAEPADRNEALCESPIEVSLYRAMRALGLKPTLQVKIGRYRADFVIGRIVVECDGHDFHSSREQRTHDAVRDRELMAAGYRVVRFTGTEIHRDAMQCARDIRRLVHIDSAGGTGRP